MAPKKAREKPGQGMGRPEKKARKRSGPGDVQIIVQVVSLSGETVANLCLESSCSVQELIGKVPLTGYCEDVPPAVLARARIAHLLHDTKLLAARETLSNAGVLDGTLLTLAFEAKPPRLRSVKREMTESQSAVEALRLQSELDDREAAVVEATAKVNADRIVASSLREKLRNAENALKRSSTARETARRWKASASVKDCVPSTSTVTLHIVETE